MVQLNQMKKLTLLVNTALLGFVVLMVGFYAHYGVTYMVYHSIPTAIMYLLFYVVLQRNLLDLYVWLVYAVITVYMIAATICLGYNSGFHLYCMSLIPLTFYMEYLARKLNTRKANALKMSFALSGIYLVSTGYVVLKGPVYQIDAKVSSVCLAINAFCVFCFLIGYSSMLQKMILESEDKLSDMAHTDRLTGLFNRHYMMTYLHDLNQDTTSEHWVAIANIDNFKGINDEYGHNAGDYVLTELSKVLKNVCTGCVTSRWGGEEFLIAADKSAQDMSILEKLRQAVEHTRFSYQGRDIVVTVTIGSSYFQAGESLDSWIQDADNKLYEGKTGGKNRVVY